MSRDPLDAKTVHAADPGPTGAERAAAVWPDADLADLDVLRYARMTDDEQEQFLRKLDDDR